MNDNPAHRANEEARARHVALSLAAAVGWQVDSIGAVLSPRFGGLLYCDKPQLLLMPGSSDPEYMRIAADTASREARSDVLIVSSDGRAIMLALGIWQRSQTQWHMTLRMWIAPDDTICLIVDEPIQAGQRRAPLLAFPLRQGRLSAEPLNWPNAGDGAGNLRALDWVHEHASNNKW